MKYYCCYYYYALVSKLRPKIDEKNLELFLKNKDII